MGWPLRVMAAAEHRERLANATVFLALATIVLAAVAVWGLVETNKSIVLAERAWIVPMGAVLNDTFNKGVPKKDDPIHVIIFFGNSGKEPAADVAIHLQNDVIDGYDPEHSDMATLVLSENRSCSRVEPVSGRAVVAPTSPGVNWGYITDSSRGGEPQFLANDRIISGDKFYVMQGCAAYRTFDQVHKTGFCYVLESRVVNGVRRYSFATCAAGFYAN